MEGGGREGEMEEGQRERASEGASPAACSYNYSNVFD